jgi:hypothetical protein
MQSYSAIGALCPAGKEYRNAFDQKSGGMQHICGNVLRQARLQPPRHDPDNARDRA